MNKQEAYSVLELSSNATPEDAKKKYRELTKKYHPDVCKDADANEKFAKINSAYDIVSGKSSSNHSQYHNPFNRQHAIRIENIDISTAISFKESVIGVKKDIKFNRKSKCDNCGGQGEYKIHNGCDKCNGRGQIVTKQGNMIFARTCEKCQGRHQTEFCDQCSGSGSLEAEISVSVSIPGGIQNDNVLRLAGMGNFFGTSVFGDQHTDVHLRVNVIAEPGLSIEGEHVISFIDISLLEALTGCQKTTKTIDGDRQVQVNPLSKNKEEITIPNLGVNRIGNQKVILQVQYPPNADKLISILSNNIEENI